MNLILVDQNSKRPWVNLGNAANFKSLSRARDFKVEVVVEEEEEDDDDDEVEEEGELGLGSDIEDNEPRDDESSTSDEEDESEIDSGDDEETQALLDGDEPSRKKPKRVV